MTNMVKPNCLNSNFDVKKLAYAGRICKGKKVTDNLLGKNSVGLLRFKFYGLPRRAVSEVRSEIVLTGASDPPPPSPLQPFGRVIRLITLPSSSFLYTQLSGSLNLN